jgi:hypothetical protein
MMLPILALAGKLLPFAAAVPDVLRAFGGSKQADAAEGIIRVAKTLTGEPDAEQAVNKIIADPALQLEYQKALMQERLEFRRIEQDAEKHASTQVTDRWKSDMAADSWMSKNIRPMTLIFILAVYTVFGAASAFGLDVNESYVTLLGQWGMLIMSAYFVGRTVEKGIDIYAKS